jgi:broad specificity phosphatase PhoE
MLLRKNTALAFAAAMLLAGAAFAAPAQVIFIRHAEKPADGPELSAQGVRRANALVNFFKTNTAVTRYGTPAAIYAAAPKNEDSSVRSVQTVTPLARAIKITVNTDFTRGQTGKLVRDIMENPAYEGRMVLVCWQHENLVEAAQKLAEYNNSSAAVYNTIPKAWPSEAFDRVWILDLKAGKVAAFKNLPQRLLPGDSAN